MERISRNRDEYNLSKSTQKAEKFNTDVVPVFFVSNENDRIIASAQDKQQTAGMRFAQPQAHTNQSYQQDNDDKPKLNHRVQVRWRYFVMRLWHHAISFHIC